MKCNLKKQTHTGSSIEIPFCILHASNRVHNRSLQRNLIRDNEPQGANASSRNRCKAYQAGRGHYAHFSAVVLSSKNQ